jgi:zeta-carotene desaturase
LSIGVACGQVDIYESRKFIGGKVGSFVDKKGNHIEMGLHVFFGCYNNLFRLLKKVAFSPMSQSLQSF